MAIRQWDRVVDHLGGHDASVIERVLGWSDDFVSSLQARMAQLWANSASGLLWPELIEQGLMQPGGGLTALGRTVAYNLREEQIQSLDFPDGQLHPQFQVGPGARLLDVGCGAGQTLRTIAAGQPAVAELVGVDVDLPALALGSRLGSHPTQYVCAAAESLPLEDNRFSHVLSRLAPTQMRHIEGIREMQRVLEPGGLLYLHFDNLGYALRLLSQARDATRIRARLLEIVLGACLAGTRFQLDPRRYPAEWIPVWRMRRLLRHFGFAILACRGANKAFGVTRSTILVARLEARS